MNIIVRDDWKLENGKFECPFCKKDYTKKGISTHIWRMHGDGKSHNPNKGYEENTREGTNQYIKGTAKPLSDEARKRISEGTKGKKIHSDEFKQSVSLRQTLHNSGGRCKWFEVDGQKLQGTWERNCALKFNEITLGWRKCSKLDDVVYYINSDGKESPYTPDLKIDELDLLLEIKGYWWGKDEEKMKLVYETNRNLGSKIIFIFKKEYEEILKASGKQEVLKIIKNAKTLEDYYI